MVNINNLFYRKRYLPTLLNGVIDLYNLLDAENEFCKNYGCDNLLSIMPDFPLPLEEFVFYSLNGDIDDDKDWARIDLENTSRVLGLLKLLRDNRIVGRFVESYIIKGYNIDTYGFEPAELDTVPDFYVADILNYIFSNIEGERIHGICNMLDNIFGLYDSINAIDEYLLSEILESQFVYEQEYFNPYIANKCGPISFSIAPHGFESKRISLLTPLKSKGFPAVDCYQAYADGSVSADSTILNNPGEFIEVFGEDIYREVIELING